MFVPVDESVDVVLGHFHLDVGAVVVAGQCVAKMDSCRCSVRLSIVVAVAQLAAAQTVHRAVRSVEWQTVEVKFEKNSLAAAAIATRGLSI